MGWEAPSWRLGPCHAQPGSPCITPGLTQALRIAWTPAETLFEAVKRLLRFHVAVGAGHFLL